MGTLDRFEGSYGTAYDAVLQRRRLRRAFFRAVGSAQPIVELERVVAQVVDLVPAGTLLDVPCGGGTLLPLLERAGFRGRVVAVDLAEAMVSRTRERASVVSAFEVDVVQADATRLPLEDASVDAAASINGLHVMPDPAAVLAELGRVLAPGGVACIVTITATRALRNRALRAVARAADVLPRDPESRDGLVALMEGAGLTLERDLGGATFAGFLVRRA